MNHSNSSKRRRTSSPTASPNDSIIQSIVDLPNDQLVAIAEYLPKTSRALFAVALTADPKSWHATGWKGKPSEASKAIIDSYPTMVGEGWELLDFDDIERDLAEKMTDEIIGSILVCIDAKNILKEFQFHLGRCKNIVGHGLEPLRGSSVLEEFNAMNGGTALSEDITIPILESIIDSDDNSVRRIMLPRKWIQGKDRKGSLVSDFWYKFNDFMHSNDFECEFGWCNGRDVGACCLCCTRMCWDCASQAGMNWSWERRSDDTDDSLFSCEHCNMTFCDSCDEKVACHGCGESFCMSCAENDGVDTCGERFCYEQAMCLGCRTIQNTKCDGCRSMAFPRLLEKNEELEGEIDENKLTINQLREEKEQMQLEIDELKSRLESGLGILATRSEKVDEDTT